MLLTPQERRNAKAQSSSAKGWPAGKASPAAPTSRSQSASTAAGNGTPAAAGKMVAISIARAAPADAKEKGRLAAKPRVSLTAIIWICPSAFPIPSVAYSPILPRAGLKWHQWNGIESKFLVGLDLIFIRPHY